MCKQHKRKINRREFLKAGGITLDATAVVLDWRSTSQALQMTAAPLETKPGSCPDPILVSEVAAYTVFVNGNMVRVDASGTSVQALAVKKMYEFSNGDKLISLAYGVWNERA